MNEKPKAEYSTSISPDNISSVSRLVLVWSERLTSDIILDTVREALNEGIRKHLLEDPEFRAKVSESIEKAVSAMPLDVIAETVRKAIVDMRADEEQK